MPKTVRAIIALCLVATLALSPRASADSFDDALDEAEEARTELEKVSVELERLDEKRSLLLDEIDEAHRTLKRKRRAIKKTQQKIEDLAERVEARTEIIAELEETMTLRAIEAFTGVYEHELGGLLAPQTTDDAMDLNVFAEALHASDDALAREVRAQERELRKEQADQVRSLLALGRERREAGREKERIEGALEEIEASTAKATEKAGELEVKIREALASAKRSATRASGPQTLDGSKVCDAGGGIQLECATAKRAEKMIAAAAEDGVVLTGSGWRSTGRQIVLRSAHCGGDIYGRPASACTPPTARPGSSQHEFGLAIDFSNCSTRATTCYQWLNENADRFGFYNLPSEAWHWSTSGS